jgi:hypothetical protein
MFKYPISLCSILHHGTSILFTAGSPLLSTIFAFAWFCLVFHTSSFSMSLWYTKFHPCFKIADPIKANECSNILVQGITILAPVTSPNTDGINPGKHVGIL